VKCEYYGKLVGKENCDMFNRFNVYKPRSKYYNEAETTNTKGQYCSIVCTDSSVPKSHSSNGWAEHISHYVPPLHRHTFKGSILSGVIECNDFVVFNTGLYGALKLRSSLS
jgi:hypothetical protein